LEPIIVPEAKRGKIMASDRSVYGLCTMKRNKLVRYKQRFIEEKDIDRANRIWRLSI